MKTIVDYTNELHGYFAKDSTIAPVEADATSASKGYSVGDQLVLDSVLYNVTADINEGDPLATTGAGANIAVADDITTQLSSVKQALSDEVVTRSTLGAHNLLQYDKASQTVDGVVFTVNSDKTITVSSSSAVSSTKNFNLQDSSYNGMIFDRDTLMSLDVDDPLPSGVNIYMEYSYNNGGNTKTITANAVHDSILIPKNTRCYMLRIRVSSTVAISSITLKPMIRDAKDACVDYAPYAMTNKELTDAVALSSETIATGLNVYKSGHVVNVRGYVSLQNSDLTVGTAYQIGSLPVGYRPSESFIDGGKAYHYVSSTTFYKDAAIYIANNGAIQVIPLELSTSTTTEFAINTTYLV